MANITVNKKNPIKTGNAAGKNDKTVLTCIEIAERTRGELEEEWELDARGKLHKIVLESVNKKLDLNDKESYVVIRAYANSVKNNNRKTNLEER